MSITSTEIQSQPDVWERALGDLDSVRAAFGEPGERVLFLGCGTSAFVAESLAILRESAGIGITDAAYASEWRPGRTYDRVVVITRSGTTSEVLDALELVESGTVKVALTGVAGMPVEALVDETVVLAFADEESVVQTRFPTTTLAIGRSIYGADLGVLGSEARRALTEAFPYDVSEFDHFVYLGTGWTRGLAQEAALKVREAAQAWSESYPLLDYRHGPIAVAHPGSLVWVFGEISPELVADIEATGARVHTTGEDPLVQLAQAQRLAVALAESRGLNPDTPRHLSRSVILT